MKIKELLPLQVYPFTFRSVDILPREITLTWKYFLLFRGLLSVWYGYTHLKFFWGVGLPLFNRETVVTYCLLPWMIKPFQNVVCSLNKRISSLGNTFFPPRVCPIDSGHRKENGKVSSHESTPLPYSKSSPDSLLHYLTVNPPLKGNSNYLTVNPPLKGNSNYLTVNPPLKGNSNYLTVNPPLKGNSNYLTVNPPLKVSESLLHYLTVNPPLKVSESLLHYLTVNPLHLTVNPPLKVSESLFHYLTVNPSLKVYSITLQFIRPESLPHYLTVNPPLLPYI